MDYNFSHILNTILLFGIVTIGTLLVMPKKIKNTKKSETENRNHE